MAGIHNYTVQEYGNLGLGQAGLDYVTNTEANTGSWVAIKAVGGDATGDFTMSIGDNLLSFVITQDDWLFGPIEEFALSSGAVIAYRG